MIVNCTRKLNEPLIRLHFGFEKDGHNIKTGNHTIIVGKKEEKLASSGDGTYRLSIPNTIAFEVNSQG